MPETVFERVKGYDLRTMASRQDADVDFDKWMDEHLASVSFTPQSPAAAGDVARSAAAASPAAATTSAESRSKSEKDPLVGNDPWDGTGR